MHFPGVEIGGVARLQVVVFSPVMKSVYHLFAAEIGLLRLRLTHLG
jgi:hypothetical protein